MTPILALLVVAVAALPLGTSAQQALRDSMSGQISVPSRRSPLENQPYTLKLGEFRLLATPSLTAEYNDNVRVSERAEQDDFILRPFLSLTGSHPIGRSGLFRLRLGLGYDYYTQHEEYSTFRTESGSELSFDFSVKDLLINIHDRFEYIRDPGSEPGVANTARYGGFYNTAGLATTWNLNDLVLTFGYDHQNFISSSSAFEYLDRSSELLLGRAGLRVHPRLSTGIEATGSFTAYDDAVLNDSVGYSTGAYADWAPGDYFRIQPRAGYTAYFFDQTSRSIRAVDVDGWYAAVSLVHEITEAVSYSINVGHEFRLGIQADSREDTYVRSAITWRIIRDLTFSTTFGYETGTQGAGRRLGNFEEDYDWFTAGLHLSHPITEKLRGSLRYRHTLRTASTRSREYNQNLVALQLTYSLQ